MTYYDRVVKLITDVGPDGTIRARDLVRMTGCGQSTINAILTRAMERVDAVKVSYGIYRAPNEEELLEAWAAGKKNYYIRVLDPYPGMPNRLRKLSGKANKDQYPPDPIPPFEDQYVKVDWLDNGMSLNDIGGDVDDVLHATTMAGMDLGSLRSAISRDCGQQALWRFDRSLAGLSNEEPPQWEDAVLPNSGAWAAMLSARRHLFSKYSPPRKHRLRDRLTAKFCLYNHPRPMVPYTTRCDGRKGKCRIPIHPHTRERFYCLDCLSPSVKRLKHIRLTKYRDYLTGKRKDPTAATFDNYNP